MKNGIQIPLRYRTNKACGRFMEFIHKDNMQETAGSLSNARVISIMFDGATDVSICENEMFMPGLLRMGYLKICL